MYTTPTKTTESNSRATDTFSAKSEGSGQAMQFADNRPEALLQRKAQEIADESDIGSHIGRLQTNIASENGPALPVLQQKETDTEETIQRMVSVDQNGELLPQSNDAAVYPNLPAGVPMTYHHIIPRNKLATFWNTAEANSHLKFLSPVIDSLVKKAIDRVKGTPSLAGSAIFDVNGNEQSKADLMAVMGKVVKDDDLSAAETQGLGIIEKIYQWWPANIHHGPTSRPTGVNVEEDDGGDEFEISARHVVKATTYDLLKKTNDLIDKYIISNKEADIKKIKGLITQLSAINEVTSYDAAKWYQITKKGPLQDRWRIKST